jgi:hypothetical protein
MRFGEAIFLDILDARIGQQARQSRVICADHEASQDMAEAANQPEAVHRCHPLRHDRHLGGAVCLACEAGFVCLENHDVLPVDRAEYGPELGGGARPRRYGT